jgi:hypothetical protein
VHARKLCLQLFVSLRNLQRNGPIATHLSLPDLTGGLLRVSVGIVYIKSRLLQEFPRLERQDGHFIIIRKFQLTYVML